MNIRSRRTICKIPSNWSGRQPGASDGEHGWRPARAMATGGGA